MATLTDRPTPVSTGRQRAASWALQCTASLACISVRRAFACGWPTQLPTLFVTETMAWRCLSQLRNVSRLCVRDAWAQIPEQIPKFSNVCLANALRSRQSLYVLSHVRRPATHVARGECISASPSVVAALRQAAAQRACRSLRLYSSSSGSGAGAPKNRNRNTAMYMVAIIVGMLGFTYCSVPLYRIFCAATGYGGTVAEGATVESKLRKRVENPDIPTEEAAAKRQITVAFAAEVQPGLKWSFKPCQKSIKIRPGQSTLVFYTAENLSDDHITAVSTYNVAPPQVGYYFNKIQCFCFEEQHLRPREKVDMPVFFYIDPEFATDRRLKNVEHLTLSYVFFKTGEVPTMPDGTELTPGESMPEYLLPSRQGHVQSGAPTAQREQQEPTSTPRDAAPVAVVKPDHASKPPDVAVR